MSTNARYSTLLLAAFFATGCYDSSTITPANPISVDPPSQSLALSPEEKASLYPLITQVVSGRGKVYFHDAGEGQVAITEVRDAISQPLIDASMEGWTFAEIHTHLAPGRPLPERLMRAKEVFTLVHPGVTGEGLAEADVNGHAAPLAKIAGQWDSWFQTNHCQSVTQCLLNRTGSSTDWMQSSQRYRASFSVMVYQGAQVTSRMKIEGRFKTNFTVLYGQVIHHWGSSSSSVWCGGRCKETFRLEISDGSGDGWHMSSWYSP